MVLENTDPNISFPVMEYWILIHGFIVYGDAETQ